MKDVRWIGILLISAEILNYVSHDLLVQDGKEAVKAKIEKRLAIFPASIKKQAARKASELTTPRMLAKQTGPKLMRKIPQSMKAKGVTIDMEEIFHEGPYMVFQLRVLHVDTVLLTRGVMEGFVDLIQWVLASVGEDLQLTIEREYCKYSCVSRMGEMMGVLLMPLASPFTIRLR